MTAAVPSARKGATLSVAASFWAAVFLVSYQGAAVEGERSVVVLAMLLCAAALNSVTSLAGMGTARQRRASVRFALDRVHVGVILALAVLTLLGNLAVTEALVRIDAGIASVVLRVQVLIVAFVGWLALGERITMRFGIGAVLALGGFAVMRLPTDGGAVVSTAGVLYALGAAASFGVMHVVTRKYAVRIELVAVNALRLWVAVAALALVPGSAAGLADLGGRGWAYAGAAAFAGPYLSRLCLMFSARHIQASHTILIALLTPVFAFALAFAVFGTVPAAIELLGAAVILAGVALPVLELVRDAPERVAAEVDL